MRYYAAQSLGHLARPEFPAEAMPALRALAADWAEVAPGIAVGDAAGVTVRSMDADRP